MIKRLRYHSLIIFAISSMIILISVNLAISHMKQPKITMMNVLNNCWEISNFIVAPGHEWICGSNWPGSIVTYYIDDDDNIYNGYYYTAQEDVDDMGDFKARLGDMIDIKPGDHVTVTDGNTTKIHVVTNITVTSVDKDLDTVSGTAEPFAEIRVDSFDAPSSRNTTADSDGYWIVDFSVPQDGNSTWDLIPGSGAWNTEIDDDCDGTEVAWHLPLPWFTVAPYFEWVCGTDWIYKDTVTVYIDNDFDLSTYLYKEEGSVNDSGNFKVMLEGKLDIKPGHIVTVTDGETTKIHVVTNITVTSVDKDLDTVSGTAEPFAEVRIDMCQEPVSLDVWAAADGSWIADFTGLLDLVPGMDGWASEREDDRDGTEVIWDVRFNEPPIAVCKNIEISAGENGEAYIIPEDIDGGSYDPDGDSITLSVDNLGPFSFGEHAVNLTVRDESGESDTCQAIVTVVDETAPIITKTEELIHEIQDCGIQQEIKNSLIKKLENAKSSIEKGNINAAINKFRAFQNEIQAQMGKKISEELAEEWIAWAEDIIQELENLENH